MVSHAIEQHSIHKYLFRGLGIALFLALAMSLSAGHVLAHHPGVSDEGIVPVVVPQSLDGGRPAQECRRAGVPTVLTKFDPASSGTQDGVTLMRTSGSTVAWEFEGFVGAVIVKNGVDGSHRYVYTEPTDSDSNLATPPGTTGLGHPIHRDISHVTFCIGEPPEPNGNDVNGNDVGNGNDVNGNDVINDVPVAGGAAPRSQGGSSWMWGLLGVVGGAAVGGFGLNMLSRRQAP